MGYVNCCKKLLPQETEQKAEIQSTKKVMSDSDSEKVRSKPLKIKESTQFNMSQMHRTQFYDRHSQETTSPELASHAEYDDNLTESIIKVQKFVRGKQARQAFDNSVKSKLYQSQMEVLGKSNKLFSSLKEAEAKVSTKPYDKNGWKEVYPSGHDFFSFNYENLKDQKIMIVPPLADANDKEVSYYTGQVNDKNERHGYGILSNSKIKHEGFWRNNSFTGWGRETTLNGNMLEGLFINGKLSGKGTLINTKGESFTGDFENGKKKGKGKETTRQFIYEGEYANNAMNGKGVIEFLEEKNKYIGDFLNNELTGTGTYIWDSGEKYEGTLLKGNYHGKGVFSWPDGQVYEGDYVNGIKEGNGKMTYPNGNIYEGPYVNGNPHGIGKYTKKGKTVMVEFDDGAFIRIVK